MTALGVADPRQASEGEGRNRQHAVDFKSHARQSHKIPRRGGRVRAERWPGVGRFGILSLVRPSVACRMTISRRKSFRF